VPLYEFRCLSCGRLFEALRSLGSGTSGLECPDCGRSDLEKEYSTFAGSSAGASVSGGCGPSGGRFT
jgi:putative FmdB family regulatory protein